MKIDFYKLIFMVESWVIFDGPDGWAKRWILFRSDVPVAQGGGSVMIWAGIVNQTVIAIL